MTATDEHAERFTLLRPLLFTIAYEILGSATEADDVLQDSYLRHQYGRVAYVGLVYTFGANKKAKSSNFEYEP